MYHCPDSFCLPFHKVCDGMLDCPEGEDEIHCNNYTCPGKHKRLIGMCLMSSLDTQRLE